MDFKDELRNLINRHSKENDSNTPDFILVGYIENCMSAFTEAIQQRETFHGRDPRPSISNKPLDLTGEWEKKTAARPSAKPLGDL